MFAFTPFPLIETKNLMLRKIESKDISDIFRMRKDSEMHTYTDTKPDEKLEDTKLYIEKMNQGIIRNEWIIWGIEHKLLGRVIGCISIWGLDSSKRSGQLAYGIIPEYQGKGLMKEALLSVVEYSFKTIKLNILEAYTEEANVNSIGLLKNCHFIEQKRVEEQGSIQNRTYNMIVYQLESSSVSR